MSGVRHQAGGPGRTHSSRARCCSGCLALSCRAGRAAGAQAQTCCRCLPGTPCPLGSLHIARQRLLSPPSTGQQRSLQSKAREHACMPHIYVALYVATARNCQARASEHSSCPHRMLQMSCSPAGCSGTAGTAARSLLWQTPPHSDRGDSLLDRTAAVSDACGGSWELDQVPC